MLGRVPSIHVSDVACERRSKGVDGRDKPDYDARAWFQLLRDHFTERQISPPMTQPEVVSVSPESDIVPE